MCHLLQTGLDSDLPAEMPEDAAENEAFLRVLHHALLEVCGIVARGYVMCTSGIPQ